MDGPGGSGDFVGREAEIAVLTARFAETKKGRTTGIVISGESGVGKTRLVSEFLDWARLEGAAVHIGRCTDIGEEGPSYWPFIEALRGADPPDPVRPILTTDPGVTPFHAHLASLLAEPAEALDLRGLVESRVRLGTGPKPLFELTLRVVSRLAERAPVVLVVEDIHWADRSTRDLLAFLLANLGQDPVMVIATYRSDVVGRTHCLQPPLAELRRNRRAEFIELLPFTRDETAALLTGLLGRHPADEVVELTWARSDGNPFMVEELAAAVARGHDQELPPTLRQILGSRVALLSRPAQQVLNLVAVAGEAVSHPLLAAVGAPAGVADAALLASLRECVDHQLLVVDRDHQTYRFRHSLLQEVLYDELLPGERAQFHAAYGAALSRSCRPGDGVAAARIAYHWR
ncbi:MAG: AAA family ATPase, partial [Actinomycetota bacterium]|nr:AAA family ATPase [Actinomycetota bacterium]